MSGPALLTNANTATFDFSTNVVGATFQCSLDGAAFTACRDPSIFTGIAAGTHTLQVRYALGMAVDPTPASYTWVVDRTAPSAPVVTGPANASFTTSLRPPMSGTAEASSTQRWIPANLRAAAPPEIAGNTTTGLPRRRPEANLLPSASAAAGAPTAATGGLARRTDAQSVRGRLGSYQRGLSSARRARHLPPESGGLFHGGMEAGTGRQGGDS